MRIKFPWFNRFSGHKKAVAKETISEPMPQNPLIIPQTVPKEILREDLLMRSWQFDISEKLSDSFIADIKWKIDQKIDMLPSQKNMVKMKSNNSYVVAGAGSGKTASLVWRILFMHVCLKIPLEEITVFSFTRKTVQELRDELIGDLDCLGIPFDVKRIEKVVRTFHSKILEFGHNSSLAICNEKLFEHLNDEKNSQKKDDTIEMHVDKIFNESTIPIKQEEYLKKIYMELYRNNADFYSYIIELYRIYLTSISLDREKYFYLSNKLEIAQERDVDITKKVHSLFNSQYKQIIPFELSSIHKFKFFANAYIKELELYVVYIPNNKMLDELKDIKYGDISFEDSLKVKERILLTFSDKNIRVVRDQQGLNTFEAEVSTYKNVTSNKKVPVFTFALAGDIREDRIWNVFFKTGVFIESSGSDVFKIGEHIDKFSLKTKDAVFAKALIIFWEYFNEKLEKEDFHRYHRIFSFFSEDNMSNFDEIVDINTLKSMRHILIDEFQDMSPEIIKWIRGCLKHLNKNNIDTSLMCIGDDWQSIYGWRGSAPYYLIKFRDEFMTDPAAENITFVINHRCHQDLADMAETVLDKIPGAQKSNKHVMCDRLVNRKHFPTLEIILNEDKKLILGKLDEFLKIAGPKESIFILCRSRKKFDIFYGMKMDKRVTKLTFHGSKGLQADYCILIGDCAYNSSSPFKNMIYEIAGHTKKYHQNFDKSQVDEARRLAYVALTRTIKKCYWFAVPQSNGCASDLKDSATYKDYHFSDMYENHRSESLD
jgi:superfamily I DNA/RNA helicase